MLRYKLFSHADVLGLVMCSSLTAFTSFSRVLPMSRMVYCANKSIRKVVYYLDYKNKIHDKFRSRVICKNFPDHFACGM